MSLKNIYTVCNRPEYDGLTVTGYRQYLLMIITAFTGMLIAVTIAGPIIIPVGAFEVLAVITPFRDGVTVINLPPIGEIRADTHLYFFELNLTLMNVDVEALSLSANRAPCLDSWLDELMAEARRGFIRIISGISLVTFLAGSLLTFFLCPRPLCRKFWQGGVLAVMFFALFLTVTLIIPYDLAAFEAPQYSGLLGAAPWAMNFFESGISAVQSMSEQLQSVTGNIFYLFRHFEKLDPVETASSLKVLHVSDIHNNPAAVDFILRVVEQFRIDLVLDTGDITDYGTPLETELVSKVAEIPVPYVLIPGNHDSPAVVNILGEAGIMVLDNEIREIKGLTIGGIADPAAYSSETVSVEKDEADRYMAFVKEKFLRKGRDDLDIIMIHDPSMAGQIMDLAPLILAGHTHRAGAKREKGTLIINPGTTGASGIRGLNNLQQASYGMCILHFRADEKGKLFLSAGDFITIPQISGGFRLERVLFNK